MSLASKGGVSTLYTRKTQKKAENQKKGNSSFGPPVIFKDTDMTPQPLNDSTDLIDKFGKFSIMDVNDVRAGSDDDGSTTLPQGCTLIPWLANSDDKENTEITCGQLTGRVASDQKYSGKDTHKSRPLGRPSTASRRRFQTKSSKSQIKREQEITVTLDESETQNLFSMCGSIVPNDTPEYIAVRDRNIALEKSKGRGMVKLNDKSVQTFHFSQREKGVLTRPARSSCIGVSWFDQSEAQEDREDTLSAFVEKVVQRAVSSKGCLLDCSEGNPSTYQEEVNIGSMLRNNYSAFASLDKIQVTGLVSELAWLERAVAMNNYFDRQLSYYGISPSIVTESMTNSEMRVGKGLTKLFSYACNLTDGRPINCMCWHKVISIYLMSFQFL